MAGEKGARLHGIKHPLCGLKQSFERSRDGACGRNLGFCGVGDVACLKKGGINSLKRKGGWWWMRGFHAAGEELNLTGAPRPPTSANNKSRR